MHRHAGQLDIISSMGHPTSPLFALTLSPYSRIFNSKANFTSPARLLSPNFCISRDL